MSVQQQATVKLPRCPYCGKALASGTRGPAAYTCGTGTCRKRAERRRRGRPSPRRQVGSTGITAAHAALLLARCEFGDHHEFTPDDVLALAQQDGVPISLQELQVTFAHLVEDTESVGVRAGDRAPTYRFLFGDVRRERRREKAAQKNVAANSVTVPSPSGAPEMGAQVAGPGHAEAVAACGDGKADARSVPDGTEHGSGESPRSGVEGGAGAGQLQHPSAPPAALRASRKASALSLVQHGESGVSAARPALTFAGADPNVRCVSPPHPDGGTSFKIAAPRAGWNPKLEALAVHLDRGAKLPKTVDLIDADGVCLTARVRRGGKGNALSLIFEGEAQLILFPRTGVAVLEAKAASLWVRGVERWMESWFDRATFFLTGARCTSPASAHGLGWATYRLELAADFVGLVLSKDDSELFTNAKGGARLVSSKGSKRRGIAETMNVGERGKNSLAVSTHDKTQAIRSKRGKRKTGEPGDSVYQATWRANDWDGEANIRRVEARAHGRALHLRATDGTPDLDLRDPVSLLDDAELGAFWLHATTTRTRLVIERPGVPLRKCPTDPRWRAVQAAGGQLSVTRYKQVPPDERMRLHRADRLHRTQEEVARALGRLAGLYSVEGAPRQRKEVMAALLRHPAFAEEAAIAECTLDGWPGPPALLELGGRARGNRASRPQGRRPRAETPSMHIDVAQADRPSTG